MKRHAMTFSLIIFVIPAKSRIHEFNLIKDELVGQAGIYFKKIKHK
ncbi:MAG TPA: hypothetical protein VF985_10935 [Mariniflexile sp.]